MKGFPSPSLTMRTLGPRGRRKRSDVENFRDRQIRAMVTHAYENVPFYRRLYDEHGVSPSKVRGFGDLQMLPVTTRNAFQRAQVTDLVARGTDLSSLRTRATNGTSGEPLILRHSADESRLLGLYYFQAFRSLGIRRTDLAAELWLRRPGGLVRKMGLLRRLLNRAAIYPVDNIRVDTPQQVFADLKRLAPDMIGGVPGLLSIIASRWSDDDRIAVHAAPWPRLVVTGGERLTKSTRQHLSQVFNARVLDMYSSTEFHLIASECVFTGDYHISDETVALEIVDNGSSAAPGSIGQAIGTALHSFASPIIRHVTGDLVTAGNQACECGVQLSTLRDIQGRFMDFLELPGGMIIHDNRIAEATAFSAPWVRQVQASQPAPDRILIRVAPMRDPSPEEIDRLRVYLEEFLNNRVTVEVLVDPDLGPQNGEKSQSLIR